MAFEANNMKACLPTKCGGTRWIGHQVRAIAAFLKSFQAIVDYLSNHSNASPKAEGLAKLATSAQVVVFLLTLQDILAPLASLSLLLQRRDATIGDAQQLIAITQDTLKLIAPEVNSKVHDVEATGKFCDRALTRSNNISTTFRQQVITAINTSMDQRFDVKRGILSAASISCFQKWPVLGDTDAIQTFGDDAIEEVLSQYVSKLEEQNVNDCSVVREWQSLKAIIYRRYGKKVPELNWQQVWKDCQNQGVDNILHVFDLLGSLPPTSVFNETTFSQLKYIKGERRSRSSQTNLNNSLLVRFEGPPIQEFEPNKPVDLFLTSCAPGAKRRVNSVPRPLQNRNTITAGQDTDDVSQSDEDEEADDEDKALTLSDEDSMSEDENTNTDKIMIYMHDD